MKRRATQHICWLILGTSLVLTFVFACSTLPPAMETQDFKSAVGKWEGWALIGTGDKIFAKLTVLKTAIGSWSYPGLTITPGLPFTGPRCYTKGNSGLIRTFQG